MRGGFPVTGSSGVLGGRSNAAALSAVYVACRRAIILAPRKRVTAYPDAERGHGDAPFLLPPSSMRAPLSVHCTLLHCRCLQAKAREAKEKEKEREKGASTAALLRPRCSQVARSTARLTPSSRQPLLAPLTHALRGPRLISPLIYFRCRAITHCPKRPNRLPAGSKRASSPEEARSPAQPSPAQPPRVGAIPASSSLPPAPASRVFSLSLQSARLP